MASGAASAADGVGGGDRGGGVEALRRRGLAIVEAASTWALTPDRGGVHLGFDLLGSRKRRLQPRHVGGPLPRRHVSDRWGQQGG